MKVEYAYRRRWSGLVAIAAMLAAAISMPAQQMVTETRDPAQPQDEEFARLVAQWTTAPYYSSPLVDHLPRSKVSRHRKMCGLPHRRPREMTY